MSSIAVVIGALRIKSYNNFVKKTNVLAFKVLSGRAFAWVNSQRSKNEKKL